MFKYKHLKVVIKGETINLCKPTLEFAKYSEWYSWLNDNFIKRNLSKIYQKNKNTKKKQVKFFLKEKNKRIILIISTKNKIYKGVISLSSIDKQKKICDIAIVTDVSVEPNIAPYAALEAMSLMTEYAFKKLKIIKINGQGFLEIRNWQQRIELLGYKLTSIQKNNFFSKKKDSDYFTVECNYEDYKKITKRRKYLWDNLKKMKNRIKKLPKKSFLDIFNEFEDQSKKEYYNRIFSY
jgi:hypothetical protein